MTAAPLLAVSGLALDLRTRRRSLRLVDDITFTVGRGELVGVVGESGSGKSLTALAILRALPPGVVQAAGRITFDGDDLAQLDARRLRTFRRTRVGAIFQDPQTSLDPAFTVGNQLVETLRSCRPELSARAAADEACSLLDRVGIGQAARRMGQYPHELSGGMAQRVMIALAISGRPSLLVADEPTTALDVTVQAQILDLLASLRADYGLSVVLISHDLAVVRDVADRVVVVYAGQVVNAGPAAALLTDPSHPYTHALLQARPSAGRKGAPLKLIPGSVAQPDAMPTGCRFAARCDHAVERCTAGPVALVPVAPAVDVRCVRYGELDLTVAGEGAAGMGHVAGDSLLPLLRIRGLTKRFGAGRGFLTRLGRPGFAAVENVDLEVAPRETLGIVGESGAGKSTVGRMILGLAEPSAGTITFEGSPLAPRATRRPRLVRRDVQVVFQNPYATLDPLMTVGNSVAEPLDVFEQLTSQERTRRVLSLLDQVGLDAAVAGRFPAELSGGQRQRVAIARAIAPSPKLIVCDEPVSSLDVSTQAQVINLLEDLQARTGVAYVFIGHDLAVVHHISDRIAVMYAGQVVEVNTADEIRSRPRHPYTRQLIDSLPGARTTAPEAGGVAPRRAEPAAGVGCRFVASCPYALEHCATVEPPITDIDPAGMVRCHLYSGDARTADEALAVQAAGH